MTKFVYFIKLFEFFSQRVEFLGWKAGMKSKRVIDGLILSLFRFLFFLLGGIKYEGSFLYFFIG